MCITFQKVCDSVKIHNIPRLQGSVSVLTAMEIMDIYEIDLVAVMCEDLFVGIFGQNEFATSVVRQNLNPKSTILYEVITLNPPHLDYDETIKEAYETMLAYQWEYMPVLKDNNLYGIVSMSDLGKDVMKSYEDARTENEMMINYIQGGESYAIATYTVKSSPH